VSLRELYYISGTRFIKKFILKMSTRVMFFLSLGTLKNKVSYVMP